MPRGFPDIASGSPDLLPARLRPLAGSYFRLLRQMRAKYPDRLPYITATQISLHLRKVTGARISGPDVRALTHFLRTERIPVASNGRGYALAVNEEELELTKGHLRDRIAAMQEALHRLNFAVYIDGGRDPELFEDTRIAEVYGGWTLEQGQETHLVDHEWEEEEA